MNSVHLLHLLLHKGLSNSETHVRVIIKVDNIRKCFSFLPLSNCHHQCFAKKQMPQMLPYEILIEILAIVTIGVIIDLAQAK